MTTELAIGFFDGVHLGHRRLIGEMLGRAREKGAKSVVYTFREHPASVLLGGRFAPTLLLSASQRIAAIKSLGVDEVAAVHFTPALAALPPEKFAASLKRRFPGLDTVFCGANWNFGAGGKGNAAFLRRLGFKVRVVPYAMRGGKPVSSTRIRAAIAAGEVKLASALLGRPWTVAGRAVRGKGLGRKIGFPTLNVRPDFPGPLPYGAYVANTQFGPAVANFGLAPTAGRLAWKSPVWELHFLDGPERALPRRLEFQLCAFLRPERRFGGVEELKEAIAADVRAARRVKCPSLRTCAAPGFMA